MNLTTQIGGKYQADNTSLFVLKHKLEDAGIKVTHPLNDEFTYNEVGESLTFDPHVWTMYDVVLSYFESISTSDFHIISNEANGIKGYIGETAALEIMYAMLKRKPIILLHAPKFKDSLDTFTKQIISTRLNKMMISNLIELDETDLTEFLNNLREPVNYVISQREETLIRSQLRAQFRRLLQQQRPVAVR